MKSLTQNGPLAVQRIECADCGLLMTLPPVTADVVVECIRCGHGVARPARGSMDASLACSAATLLLLLPAVLAPLMDLTTFGIQRNDWLPTGAAALWNDGFIWLAAVVFLCSIAVPFIYFGMMSWILGGVRLGVTSPLGVWMRWAAQLRPWVMIEVYLVGCCVAYTRLQAVGTIDIGVGGWCLTAAAMTGALAIIRLDERALWDMLPAGSDAPDTNAPVISCAACELLLDTRRPHPRCPRCDARLHWRKPDALRRTLALVIAGFLLYLPANLLPVLSIERFGRNQPSTLLGGVHELIVSGLWPLALIVLLASIVVPLMKLFGLSLMLLLTRMRSQRWLVGRTRLYRLIDVIGRWSFIDVFMISILAALVRFGALTSVRPQAGAVAFAAVIILTIIASRSFDPRLMWDAGSTA